MSAIRVLPVLLLAALPVAGWAEPPAPSLDETAATMRPGQYRWDAPADAAGPVAIGVSLAMQRLYVYRGGTVVGVAAVSTGRPGHRTPAGDYTILGKARWHRSNLYSNAPMPWMQRLTNDGIALHAGVNPGRPASHGCIRLPPAFARDLFALTAVGEPVTVAEWPLHAPVELSIEWPDSAEPMPGPAPLPYDPAALTQS